MLELRLGWCERYRKLAEELGMRVQGVAGLRPGLVGNLTPLRRHTRTLLKPGRAVQRLRPTRPAGPAVLERGSMEGLDVLQCLADWLVRRDPDRGRPALTALGKPGSGYSAENLV